MHQFIAMPITFIVMKFIYAFSGLITLGLIVTLIHNKRNSMKLFKAQKLFHETKQCGHHYSEKWDFYIPAPSIVSGIKSTTNKWCKVCGRFLGPKEIVND